MVPNFCHGPLWMQTCKEKENSDAKVLHHTFCPPKIQLTSHLLQPTHYDSLRKLLPFLFLSTSPHHTHPYHLGIPLSLFHSVFQANYHFGIYFWLRQFYSQTNSFLFNKRQHLTPKYNRVKIQLDFTFVKVVNS